MEEDDRNGLYAGPESGVDTEFCSDEDERPDKDGGAAEDSNADVRATHVPNEGASGRPAGHRAVVVWSARAHGSLQSRKHSQKGDAGIEHADAGPDVSGPRDLRDAGDDECVEPAGEEAVEHGEGHDGRERVRAEPEREREDAA